MSKSMNFIAQSFLNSLAEGSIQQFVDDVSSKAESHFSGDGMRVLAVHDNKVTLVCDESASVYVAPFTGMDSQISFGPVEEIESESYASEADWAMSLAESVANDIAIGAVPSDVKGDLLLIAESVARGNAFTSEGLLRGLRMKLEARSSWVDVYSTRDREIRGYIRGEVSSLKESIPKKRFRVLATEHSPSDPEKYRDQVVESLRAVLDKYNGIAKRLISVTETVDVDGFVGVDSGVLLQNLSGFITSLRESAESVSVDGVKFLTLEAESGDLSRMSRLHDLLAEGLEDYLICSAFSEKLVREIRESMESKS